MLPHQADGVHDFVMWQLAKLHEAEHLIDPGCLVFFDRLDARVGHADVEAQRS